jgi:DNA-binding MarR family transcriptional regulator
MGILGRISRIAVLAQREFEREFARHGLAASDFDVLAALRRAGSPFELKPGVLSTSTMTTTGGMTKRLDRLEERGLIRRTDDPGDRRGKLIVLTDEGRVLVDLAVESHLRNEERMLASLAPAHRDQLVALLRPLLIALEDG